mmetsp:Transcript_12295/g.51711  ORF Transcript_12295/g.51711 Transcript_12295/m.51711 type:complete len:149 (-) Transcript_12295:39-485(-)
MVENTEPPPELFNHREKGEQNHPNEERGRVEAMDEQGKRNFNSNDRAVPSRAQDLRCGGESVDRAAAKRPQHFRPIYPHHFFCLLPRLVPNNCSSFLLSSSWSLSTPSWSFFRSSVCSRWMYPIPTAVDTVTANNAVTALRVWLMHAP